MGDLRLRPVEEALLLCLRRKLDAAHTERLHSLFQAGRVSWDDMWAIAREQQVLPLVAQAIAEGPLAASASDDAMREARAVRLRTMLHNLASRTELRRVGELLLRHGVPVVPLKGTHLAERVFGSLEARQCGDIDLLVPESECAVAWSLLQADGYVPAPDVSPGVREHPFHGVPLVRRGRTGPSVVELHWNLTDPRFADIDYPRLWERILARNGDEQGLHSLPAEETLVFLALHLPKHDFGVLRLLADIDRLVRLPEQHLDWERVTTLARRWRVTGQLSFALGLARTLFDTPVPEAVLDHVAPSALRRALVARLAGPRPLLRPVREGHLHYNRCRLAYCLMLTPMTRSLQAYITYFFPAASEHPTDVCGRLIRPFKRVGGGLARTGMVCWSALTHDWRA